LEADVTLQQLLDHLKSIFSDRNARYLPEVVQRLAFLTAGIRQLEDGYEENLKGEYAGRLAYLFARWCAAVELVEDLSPLRMLAAKYGHCCSYCMAEPCACSQAGRPESATMLPNPACQAWSLRQWQQHLGQLYGAKNKARGVNFVLLRLFSENTEALSCWLLVTMPPAPEPTHYERRLNKFRGDLALELCDVLAWILAAANILSVDLEKAVMETYGHGCNRCEQPRCGCTWPEFSQGAPRLTP
jgi:NTP pyrophosphatase (non-canonical NTP hydrolase)